MPLELLLLNKPRFLNRNFGIQNKKQSITEKDEKKSNLDLKAFLTALYTSQQNKQHYFKN